VIVWVVDLQTCGLFIDSFLHHRWGDVSHPRASVVFNNDYHAMQGPLSKLDAIPCRDMHTYTTQSLETKPQPQVVLQHGDSEGPASRTNAFDNIERLTNLVPDSVSSTHMLDNISIRVWL
jgi:hypothetical protein